MTREQIGIESLRFFLLFIVVLVFLLFGSPTEICGREKKLIRKAKNRMVGFEP
jgi:hypothetical protein